MVKKFQSPAAILALITNIGTKLGSAKWAWSPFLRHYCPPDKSNSELHALHLQFLQEKKVSAGAPPAKEEKLRQKIRELEEHLANHSAVYMTWREHGSLLVVLDNLMAVHCNFSDSAVADVEKIYIDRSAVADVGSDVIVAADMDVLSGVLVAATKGGRMLLFDDRKHGGKLATAGSKLGDFQVPCSVELPSAIADLSINCSSNLVLAVCEKHLIILSLTSPGKGGPKHAAHQLVVVLSDPALGCFNAHGSRFSRLVPGGLLLVQCDSLESSLGDSPPDTEGSRTESYFAARTFEYSSKERRLVPDVSSRIVGIKGKVTAVEWSCLEDQVVVGCEDGSVILQDLERGTLRRFDLIPNAVTSLRWHPTGALLAAAFSSGQVAVLDSAVQALYVASDRGPADVAIDLNAIQGRTGEVRLVEWCKRASAANSTTGSGRGTFRAHLGAVVDRGGLAAVRVSLECATSSNLRLREIVSQHLRNGEPKRALAVIQCSTSVQETYYGLLRLAETVLCLNSTVTAGSLAEKMIALIDNHVLALDAQHSSRLGTLLHTLSHRLLREGKAVAAYGIARKFEDIMLAKDAVLLAEEKKEPKMTAAIQKLLAGEVDPSLKSSSTPLSAPGISGEQLPGDAFALAQDILQMIFKDDDFKLAASQIPEDDWSQLPADDAFLLGLYFATSERHEDAVVVHKRHYSHWYT